MSVFQNVNKHCFDKIASLSEDNAVIAADDIYDQNGVKLWAKGGRISAQLQERLANRKLRTPLELSLEVERSLSMGDVVEDCIKIIAADPALTLLAGNRTALATLSHLRMVKLPSVLRLLLSAAYAKKGKDYQHVLYAVAICAGFASQADLSVSEVETLLATALLHDLGEMYINPEYLNSNRILAAKEWSAVAAHPKVGSLVAHEIGKLTDAIGLGIAHHHERLDGSGYPAALTKERVSRIGAMLAAADATAGILKRGGEGAAYQAALAIRLIPEEFDPAVRSFVCAGLRDLAIESSVETTCLVQTKLVVAKLDRSEAAIEDLLPKSTGKVRVSLMLAKGVCDNVRKAIRATGIDYLLQTVSSEQSDEFFTGEVSQVVRETNWRLRNLARNIQLQSELQPPQEQAALSTLIELLESQN